MNNGEIVRRGVLTDFHTPAGESEPLVLPLEEKDIYGESYVNLYVQYKEDQFFAGAGEELFRTQIRAGYGIYCPKCEPLKHVPLTVDDTKELLTISGG